MLTNVLPLFMARRPHTLSTLVWVSPYPESAECSKLICVDTVSLPILTWVRPLF